MAEPMTSHSDQVRQLFDGKAPAWSAKYGADGQLTGRLASFAAALTSHVPAAGTMLDLGCGTGDLARAAAAAGMLVTACDISQEMLRRAADRDPRRAIRWLQLSPGWRTLPVGPASFDAVVASSVLEYVDHPSRVLGEFARVLRPGGIVLCTVPDPAHPVRWLERLAGPAARSPLARAAAGRWPRLDGYLGYLRISRQQHRAGWWRAAAARAGLLTVAGTAETAPRQPLRMLVFQRPTG